MKILAIKVSPIGDTVLFLPSAQALQAMPGCQLTVITSPVCAPLFQGFMEPGNVWTFGRRELQKSWRKPWLALELLRRVRRLRPDAVLLSFDQSSMARALALASRADLRIGGAGSVVRFQSGLTDEVAPPPGGSIAAWEWEMAAIAAKRARIPWALKPSPPRLAARLARNKSARRVVAIHPGSSRPYTNWGHARYAQLAARLGSDFDVKRIAAPGEAHESRENAETVAPRDLTALIGLLSGADLFVGNHSGPFHLAAALGVPCIIPTGPTRSECDPPWLPSGSRLLRMPGLACRPCDGLTVSAERCVNLLTPMACMNHWSVEAIEAECRAALAASG